MTLWALEHNTWGFKIINYKDFYRLCWWSFFAEQLRIIIGAHQEYKRQVWPVWSEKRNQSLVVAVWQITSRDSILPTDLKSVCLYSRQHDGTDSYEKTVFQLSLIFLLSPYILDIYKEHLLSVHLKEPSKRTHRNIEPTEEDYQEKVFTIKMPTTRKEKRYFLHIEFSRATFFFFFPKLKNTVEKHDPQENKKLMVRLIDTSTLRFNLTLPCAYSVHTWVKPLKSFPTRFFPPMIEF